MGEYKSQTQAVLEHLKKHKTITSMQSYSLYGVTRLSDVIFRLRKKGYVISNKDCSCKNRFGTKSQFVTYRLEEANVG